MVIREKCPGSHFLTIKRPLITTTLKTSRSRQYPTETFIDADYADCLLLLTNTPEQVKCLLHRLKQAVEGFGLYMSSDKTEFMCFKQGGAIPTLNAKPLKLIDHFSYLGRNISSTENNVNICFKKLWATISWLLTIWKSDFYDKIKQEFF